jgi:hypothetical protein
MRHELDLLARPLTERKVGEYGPQSPWALTSWRREDRLAARLEVARLVERVNRGDVYTGLMGRGDPVEAA